jgi:hypothetical protein
MLKKTLVRRDISETASAGNVVVLHPRLARRDLALLARWLESGRRMGLCDASAFPAERGTGGHEYVLVWVRENPDPAYMIRAEGRAWVVRDAVRAHDLARLPSFAAALHFIRPVLSLEVAA